MKRDVFQMKQVSHTPMMCDHDSPFTSNNFCIGHKDGAINAYVLAF